MRTKKGKLTEAVKQVLDNGDILTVKQIYHEVEKRMNFPPEKKIKTYGRPKYTHAVRSTLLSLVSKKEIVRVDRGKYRKSN